MFPRRVHRKSRSGCEVCKRRHVKCGEEHPQCQNCIDYEFPCQYRALPHLPSSSSSPLSLSLSKQRSLVSPTVKSGHPHPSPVGLTGSFEVDLPRRTPTKDETHSGAGANNSNSVNLELNITDLELLHHFSTVTYITMSNVPDEQSLWQSTMVRIGFKYPFLLRGILAFSALHLGYLNPEQSLSYLVTSSAHQDTAISQFREILTSVDSSNFDPVLAFSCLLPLHSLANTTTSRLRKHISDQETLSSFLDSVRLLRGINVFLPSWSQFPSSSSIMRLAQVAIRSLPEALTFSGVESLNHLENVCTTLSTSTFTSSYATSTIVLTKAISQLRVTFSRLATKTALEQFTIGITLLWIYEIPDNFIALLSEYNGMALAILAHFATLLCQQNHVWWLEGLGSALIAAISALLGEEWTEVLAWPKEVANLI